jgi:hypothetical protein
MKPIEKQGIAAIIIYSVVILALLMLAGIGLTIISGLDIGLTALVSGILGVSLAVITLVSILILSGLFILITRFTPIKGLYGGLAASVAILPIITFLANGSLDVNSLAVSIALISISAFLVKEKKLEKKIPFLK